MAQIELEFPISSIKGKIGKKATNAPILRQKTYRDADGRILATGAKEAYVVANPRDYKKHPLRGQELQNVNAFRQAITIAQQERANPERLAYWTERWKAQLAHPEPDAPIDPHTHTPKIYHRLDSFIIAVLKRNQKQNG